jgi:NAD(P)-dependent dehydrogenase (short-subunit alcohol dehydrogenase family)
VVALDRNEHAMSDLPDAVHKEAAGPADPGAVTRLIDQIAAEAGPPGVLVNTVGAFRLGDALATTPETLRLMLDVNLGPALWLSQAVAPQLIDTASNRDRGQSGTRTSGHMRCLAGSGAGRKSLGAQSRGLSVAFCAFPLVELA